VALLVATIAQQPVVLGARSDRIAPAGLFQQMGVRGNDAALPLYRRHHGLFDQSTLGRCSRLARLDPGRQPVPDHGYAPRNGGDVPACQPMRHRIEP
jgi:hypothetical protein